MAGTQLKVGLLGPLVVRADDIEYKLDGAESRLVLVTLALSAGREVSVPDLIAALWGSNPPDGAPERIAEFVATLRGLIGEQVITATNQGYVLETTPDNVDVLHFRSLVAEANDTASAQWSRRLLDSALSLWRGEPLAGLEQGAFQRDEANRLLDEKLGAQYRRIELDLALGRHLRVLSELEQLTGRYPVRQQFWAQRMVALYRAGRVADALDCCRVLTDMGIEPDEELQQLRQAILDNDIITLLPDRPAVSISVWPVTSPNLVDHLLDEISGSRGLEILAIVGRGNSGKTALAAELTQQLRDKCRDGQFLIDLRGDTRGQTPMHPVVALQVLLGLAGVAEAHLPRTLDERSALWGRTLENREIVLVIDNASSLAQVRPLLPIAARGVVVVTSRRRLLGLAPARTIELDDRPRHDTVDLRVGSGSLGG